MKKYIPLIFTAIFPYYIVGILCAMFVIPAVLNTGVPDLSICLLLIPVLFLVGLIGSIVFAILALTNRLGISAVETARINMIVKLSQIPAFILIFIMGVMCLITIFTLGISIALAILDGMAVFLTGIVGAVAVWSNYKEKSITKEMAIVLGICQFIFCLDVITAIVLYVKAKKGKENGFTEEKAQ